MTGGKVDSGLPFLGTIPWGAHFCQFCEQPGDLAEMVVPFFQAGLEVNHACRWVTDVLPVEAAADALRAAVPDLDARRAAGQIEIVDARDVYSGTEGFDPGAVITRWIALEEAAVARGFEGLRVTGSAFWIVGRPAFDSFVSYEAKLNAAFQGRRIACLCSYPLHGVEAVDMLDVVHSHQFTAARRHGKWELVEYAALEVHGLREAVRARDEFVSVAAHELRTPVTSLQLCLQGLTTGHLSETPERLARSLHLAEKQTRRLAGLVQQLVEVSRIQAGHLDLRLGAVDLPSLVRAVAARFREELGRAGCALSVAAAAPLAGRWDESRLDEVLTDLLSNAIKFGAGRPIEIRVEEQGGTARIVVRDHGVGIAPDRLPHIFDRFERAAPARHYGGLGLGLYIADRIVRALGGSMRAESTVGVGSTFTVELPVAGPAPGRVAG